MDELNAALQSFYCSSLGLDNDHSALAASACEHAKSAIYRKYVNLLKNPGIEEEAWSESMIIGFLEYLSALDSNNFQGAVGVGEREGRILHPLVSRRHFGFAHGIGRSGNLMDAQPKAVGSTTLQRLLTKLTKQALMIWGLERGAMKGGLVLMPTATGMTLTLALLAVENGGIERKRKVLWMRIDQKSCFKAVIQAGLDPIIIDPIPDSKYPDQLVSNISLLKDYLNEFGTSIHSIVSCTSCFAPRVPDDIVEIGKLAESFSIPHIVNNAYGGCSRKAMNLLNETIKIENNRRVDAVVMSLDKNWMVPVGGAIIFSPKGRDLSGRVAEKFPGRASITGIIDLFITLMGTGRKALLKLNQERKETFKYFKDKLGELSEEIKGRYELRLMETPANDISLAIELKSQDPNFDYTRLGSLLFYRGISGARVVNPTQNTVKLIEGREFRAFGSHQSEAKKAYLNVAAAVGMTKGQVDDFTSKLRQVLNKL